MSEADVLKFSYNPATDTIRKEKKEIRGVWLTTVNNSDWPKTKGNIKAQKKKLSGCWICAKNCTSIL
ncbi:MAG: hypothetical protein IPL55_12105 [Saprospiraceae bacterium]|nr:hypothetical protein [Saprospiraceae bacterium]